MTLSRKMRRGPVRRFLAAPTFRMQNEGQELTKLKKEFYF